MRRLYNSLRWSSSRKVSVFYGWIILGAFSHSPSVSSWSSLELPPRRYASSLDGVTGQLLLSNGWIRSSLTDKDCLFLCCCWGQRWVCDKAEDECFLSCVWSNSCHSALLDSKVCQSFDFYDDLESKVCDFMFPQGVFVQRVSLRWGMWPFYQTGRFKKKTSFLFILISFRVVSEIEKLCLCFRRKGSLRSQWLRIMTLVRALRVKYAQALECSFPKNRSASTSEHCLVFWEWSQ